MKSCRTVFSLAVVGMLFTCGGHAQAALLSVDFQNSNNIGDPPGAVLESGFMNFDNTHVTGGGNASATYGDITVELSGMDLSLFDGLFNRDPAIVDVGSLTYADLYNEFAFNNNAGNDGPASMTLKLSGAGIAANQQYLLTFYSYDNHPTQGSHSVDYTGISGTVGSAGPLTYTSSESADVEQSVRRHRHVYVGQHERVDH